MISPVRPYPSPVLPPPPFRPAASGPAVEVDLGAIAANLRWARGAVGAGVELHAVLKADAYGHGAAVVARTVAEHRLADRLVVATLGEAAALPATGLPVTVLRPIDWEGIDGGDALDAAVRAGWTLTVHSAAAAVALADRAARLGARAPVQLMVDTGMNRCGIEPEALEAVAAAVAGRPDALDLQCLATHLARQDGGDEPFVAEQIARFDLAVDRLAARRPDGRPVVRCAGASGAMIRHPAAHFGAVRVGAAMYGIDPGGVPDPGWPPRPAMRWVAPLSAVRTVEPGTGVGYGHSWSAARRSRLGLVPIGYHDGYPRLASNRAHVIVAGRPCPVVGRVGMDSIVVDVTDVPSAAAGARVVVLDDDPDSPASAYALGRASESIADEIIARTGPRLPRRYAPVSAAR